MVTKLTRADGSTLDTVQLDYGLRTIRDPGSGVLLALPSGNAGAVTRFDLPDGSFGFQLPELNVSGFRLPGLDPGDRVEFGYEYFAQASTGFGETAILAAIGDPF